MVHCRGRLRSTETDVESAINDYLTTPIPEGIQQKVFPHGLPSSSYHSNATWLNVGEKTRPGVFFGKSVFFYLFLNVFFFLSFVVVPSDIITSSDQTMTAPAELTLNCSADGKPKPTITWTRVSDNTVVYMPLNIHGGKNEERYRCSADNGVGKPLTKVVSLTILCE